MNINKIEWRDIYLDGFSSDYMISNDGRVMNKETNEIRIPSLTPNGYLTLALYRHGISYSTSIHRLVAEYFVPNSDVKNNTQVDHKDGNKQNNWYWNLEWVTPKENKQRAIKLGLCNPKHGNQPKGSKSGVSIHTEEEAHEVCKLLEKNLSNKEISDMLGLSTEFIRSIKRGRAWNHISKDYKLPSTEKRNYYPKEIRDKIKLLIDQNKSDLEIAQFVGLPDPAYYGRKYINKIRSRYLQDKGSTTIPRTITANNK